MARTEWPSVPGQSRIARIGTLACPSAAPSKVVAPKRVPVNLAGKRFEARVLTPKWIAAEKSTQVWVRLPKTAAKRLQGHKATVAVKVTVLINHHHPKTTSESAGKETRPTAATNQVNDGVTGATT